MSYDNPRKPQMEFVGPQHRFAHFEGKAKEIIATEGPVVAAQTKSFLKNVVACMLCMTAVVDSSSYMDTDEQKKIYGNCHNGCPSSKIVARFDVDNVIEEFDRWFKKKFARVLDYYRSEYNTADFDPNLDYEAALKWIEKEGGDLHKLSMRLQNIAKEKEEAANRAKLAREQQEAEAAKALEAERAQREAEQKAQLEAATIAAKIKDRKYAYILSETREKGRDIEEVLREAEEMSFVEPEIDTAQDQPNEEVVDEVEEAIVDEVVDDIKPEQAEEIIIVDTEGVATPQRANRKPEPEIADSQSTGPEPTARPTLADAFAKVGVLPMDLTNKLPRRPTLLITEPQGDGNPDAIKRVPPAIEKLMLKVWETAPAQSGAER